MENMKRIDVLKGIEQILVQKAYEKGHISHRKDGDWQKTDNGWKRISGYDKGSHQWKSDKRQRSLTAEEIQELQQISDIDERRKRQSEMLSQPAPDTDDSAERAEYERQLTEEQKQRAEDDPTGYGYEEPPSSGEIVEQDFESIPNSIKDKMFTIAQQYKAEWAEDSDEDMRSMADDDVEAISQMLWDSADEETRNSWLDSDSEDIFSDEAYEQDDENRAEMSPKQVARHLLENGDYDSAINQIDFEEDEDGIPFTYDDTFEVIVDNVMNDMDMSDEEKKANRGTISRAIMERAQQLKKPADYDVDRHAVDNEEFKKNVNKSKYRDMRSIPATKNMGF